MSETGRTLAERTRRRRLAALAGHTGDVAGATAYLDDADPVVRSTALRALDRLGALDDATIARAGRDADSEVRRSAAELLGRRRAADLDNVVVDLLRDPDPTVVEVAAWTAGEREEADERVVRRLIELATEHDDALVREAAVAALGAIGDPRGLPAILAGTRDRATVRRRAVLALAPFDGPEVDEALRRALADRDWQVRQAAEDLTT